MCRPGQPCPTTEDATSPKVQQLIEDISELMERSKIGHEGLITTTYTLFTSTVAAVAGLDPDNPLHGELVENLRRGVKRSLTSFAAQAVLLRAAGRF